jgi:hypothetical protein
MSHGVTFKKTIFFLMLHNTKICSVLHRTVVNGLVFVMGSVDVFCELQTEWLEVIYEVSRTHYSKVTLDRLSVRM